MSVLTIARVAVLALVVWPVTSDIISDITTSDADQARALEIKAKSFWEPILSAAQEVKLEEHLVLYADVEAVIKVLPAENAYVRQTLQAALEHLKSADDVSFKQALNAAGVAKEKLEGSSDTSSLGLSFLTGGHIGSYMKTALKRFVGGGQYPEKLVEHVQRRQEDVLPVLRGAAESTGNILSDCRLASKLSFDVRKYDIYNDNVPKTPQSADDIADRIIAAAGETRSRFTRSITDMVNGITKDFVEKQEDAGVTVTKDSLKSLHTVIADAEEKLPSTPPKGLHAKIAYAKARGMSNSRAAEPQVQGLSSCIGCSEAKAPSILVSRSATEQLMDL